ncbi:MAG: hypothetical protein UW21_C0023G0005 [Candidatus Woesebacteria bacterium GW2011_GWB1_44_11b]|uniref:O-antigen ligase-related domain-containing protein n=1 Tax=Candidatus Woesebacteria bacterium GW2011_GWB1_44_11b TaxID=1618580 RepID=A0A0G1GC87_9BACT|nr:MAG: hypothetical protein UW21_C0023G0005 [Candidatus Woesebacteria bacterium GW2011_GWB1_44_11b]
MVIRKKIPNYWLILPFTYLIFFPFGQLTRVQLDVAGQIFAIYPTDILAGLTLVPLALNIRKLFPKEITALRAFLVAALFSLIFSLAFFPPQEILIGTFYFFRLVFYISFFVFLWRLVKLGVYPKEKVINSLIAVGTFVGLFGWAQYLFYPDLRALKEFGWDDHLYRLVSTFLDPAFTGIILVLALILVFSKISSRKSPLLVGLSGFLLFSIAFTYSRSSFLAILFAGLTASLLGYSKKIIWIPILIFFLGLVFLPRPAGEGVRLERLNSVILKTGDYKESLQIIRHSPLFGVGFNNLCVAKMRFFGGTLGLSHSCGGTDNSFLFVVATTGLVGLVFFIDLVIKIIRNTSRDEYGRIFLVSLTALFVHGMFTNTLFYAWVMGWLVHLLAISRRS